MIGLLMLFFIGRYYYQLAFEYEKNKWVFAIIGIACFYAGTIIFGFVFGFIAVATDNISMIEMDDMLLGLMALPFGILATWGLYRILNNTWKNKKAEEAEHLIDKL